MPVYWYRNLDEFPPPWRAIITPIAIWFNPDEGRWRYHNSGNLVPLLDEDGRFDGSLDWGMTDEYLEWLPE